MKIRCEYKKLVPLAELKEHPKNRNGHGVLDLFGGSGATLIAAAKTGRKAMLMELDPKYVDVIIKRWEALSGERAEKV